VPTGVGRPYLVMLVRQIRDPCGRNMFWIVCKALWAFFMEPIVVGICWVDGYLDGRVVTHLETRRRS
jgi:hypothetical protein